MSDYMNVDVLLRSPSNLKSGDMINDRVGQRIVEVGSVQPTVIYYWGEPVPVWEVRGQDSRTLKGNRDVKLLCVPRFRWEVVTGLAADQVSALA